MDTTELLAQQYANKEQLDLLIVIDKVTQEKYIMTDRVLQRIKGFPLIFEIVKVIKYENP